MDADSHRELGERYGVKGFPTLKIFRRGVVFDYEGPRETSAGIVDYVRVSVACTSHVVVYAA